MANENVTAKLRFGGMIAFITLISTHKYLMFIGAYINILSLKCAKLKRLGGDDWGFLRKQLIFF